MFILIEFLKMKQKFIEKNLILILLIYFIDMIF